MQQHLQAQFQYYTTSKQHSTPNPMKPVKNSRANIITPLKQYSMPSITRFTLSFNTANDMRWLCRLSSSAVTQRFKGPQVQFCICRYPVGIPRTPWTQIPTSTSFYVAIPIAKLRLIRSFKFFSHIEVLQIPVYICIFLFECLQVFAWAPKGSTFFF